MFLKMIFFCCPEHELLKSIYCVKAMLFPQTSYFIECLAADKKVKYKPTFFTLVNRVKMWKWPSVKWKWYPCHSAFSRNILLVFFRYFWEHWEGTHSPSRPFLRQGSCTLDGIWHCATLLTFLLPVPFVGFFFSTLCAAAFHSMETQGGNI